MNTMKSILINYILNNVDDGHLRNLFVTANVFAGGMTDRDSLDNVSEAVITHLQTMTEEERVMTLRFIHSLKDFREVTA